MDELLLLTPLPVLIKSKKLWSFLGESLLFDVAVDFKVVALNLAFAIVVVVVMVLLLTVVALGVVISFKEALGLVGTTTSVEVLILVFSLVLVVVVVVTGSSLGFWMLSLQLKGFEVVGVVLLLLPVEGVTKYFRIGDAERLLVDFSTPNSVRLEDMGTKLDALFIFLKN